MLLRASVSLIVMAILMWLVKLQINATNDDGFLTVEQLVASGIKALSFDRHFAMTLDFCIMPGAVALSIFLCSNQWKFQSEAIAAVISVAVILLCVYVLWIGGTEAHVHDRKPTEAGIIHGMYAAVAVWVFIMVLAFTPKPEPVLLLIMCIVVPAFFFVGTHMFLGMINFAGAASTYAGKPLRDPVGWSVLIVATGAVWWRTWMLVPADFWQKFQ